MSDIIVQASLSVVGTLGLLALVVNIIVEMTKEFKSFINIPTKLYAIVVSIFVNYAFLAMYVINCEGGVNISYYILAFLGAFIVAFLSINGWDTFDELKDRYLFGNKKQ